MVLAQASSSADTTVLAAFAVGFVSFISPCVLPLVPGYLSAVSGVSIAELREGDHKASRVLWPAIIFCLSFTFMFVALGMSATGLGQTLNDNRATFDKIAGGLIVLMGVFFLASPFIPLLNREWRPDALIRRAGSGGPLIAGAAFAFAWTPCIGPTLSSILIAASTSDSVGHGGVLLAFYSAGLAIPFLLTALAFDRMTGAWRWLREHYLIITAISGAILIIMGVLIFTEELTRLNTDAQKLLGNLGLDFIYSL
jgi:cytochrome c-type biogenesis protein